MKTLKSEGLQVSGIVCHVGKDEDRKRLINKVISAAYYMYDVYLHESTHASLLFRLLNSENF